MPHKKRPLDRDSGVVRDASLVVIACEDTHAVKQYFARFRTRRVQFIVLPTEEGCSSPKDVLARLDSFKETEATEEGDLFWICIDTDHWVQANHIQNLREVLQQCRQKNYDVAINNPCFELWLLLHFEDWQSGAAVSCGDVTTALRRAAGSYQKKRCAQLAIGATGSAGHEASQRHGYGSRRNPPKWSRDPYLSFDRDLGRARFDPTELLKARHPFGNSGHPQRAPVANTDARRELAFGRGGQTHRRRFNLIRMSRCVGSECVVEMMIAVS